MSGVVQAQRLWFVVDTSRSETDLEAPLEICEDCFDEVLRRSGRLPATLGSAPVASWLLARLVRLTDHGLGFPTTANIQWNDGGGYMIDFVAFDQDRSGIADFQLQGNTEGVAVLGDCGNGWTPEEVLGEFAGALLAAPEEVAPSQLGVYDLEWDEVPESFRPRPWQGSRNWYGWDGQNYLGSDNIREV
jgi:hypothetical protein